MLILGGAATVTSLTGMSTIAVGLWHFYHVLVLSTHPSKTLGLLPDPIGRRRLCRGGRNEGDSAL